MNLDKFNLNLFVALEAVLHSRSLTEAARKLHLSQPALSIALKKLREMYNDEIVVYTSGGEPVLTAMGESLKPRVSALIQIAKDTMRATPVFDEATAHARFSLVAPDVLELLYLRSVYVDVIRRAPHVHVSTQAFRYEPVEATLNRGVDLVIAADAFVNPAFSQEELFSERFACMVWEGNAQVGGQLEREQYMRMGHADLAHEAAQAQMPAHPAFNVLRQISAGRRIVLHASGYASLPHLVVGTELVVTTLSRYAKWCAARLPIRVLPFPFEMPVIRYHAQWQPYRDEDPAMLWMRERLRTAAQQMPPLDANAG